MRAGRVIAAVVGCCVLFAVVLAVPDGTGAAEFETGDVAEVAAGQTVDDDLYVAGGQVKIRGRVTGDVVGAGGEIEIPGQVDGAVSVVGGAIEITGSVGRSVRVVGGNVTIAGTVGGDVLLFGGALTLEPTGSVGGDVILAGGDVELRGAVAGEVRGNVGSLSIDDRVGGDVDVTVGELSLGPGARVAGDLAYASREAANVAEGAAVAGGTARETPDRFYPGDNVASWLGSPIFRLLCALVAGATIVLLLPRAAAAMGDAVRMAPLTALLTGIALLICLPVLFLVLLITVVGAPVALIGLAAYLAVLYLSQVFLGLAIGRMVLPSSWNTAGRGYNLLAMTIGVVILAGLRLVPLPFLGHAVAALTAVLGLGAIVVAIRATRRPAGLPAY